MGNNGGHHSLQNLRTPENAELICDMIGNGISVRQVAEKLGCVPKAIRLWRASDPEFSARYEIARVVGYELLADDLLEVADNVKEDPASRRVRVDTRKWILSKMIPKVYGDKVTITLEDMKKQAAEVLADAPDADVLAIATGDPGTSEG